MKQLFKQKNTLPRLALSALLALCLLLALGVFAGEHGESASSLQERSELLQSLGWEIDPASEAEQIIHIPEEFSPVYDNYNRLQQSQGYDLSDYAGRDCTLYSYTVTNYPDPAQTVIANLYVIKGRVIGGDIHSTSLNGFMVGIR